MEDVDSGMEPMRSRSEAMMSSCCSRGLFSEWSDEVGNDGESRRRCCCECRLSEVEWGSWKDAV